MFGWLNRLADEGHRSQRVAKWWHLGHVVLYGFLIGGYISMAAWHLAAAGRHAKAANLLDHEPKG